MATRNKSKVKAKPAKRAAPKTAKKAVRKSAKTARAVKPARQAAPKPAAAPQKQPQGLPPAPQEILMQILTGPWLSQALCAVTRRGVPDFLSHGPKTAAEIAAATHTNADAMHRTMRALAGIGLFKQTSPRHFALTPLSELLCSDAPGSLEPIARFFGEPFHWQTWANFGHSLETGKPAHDHTHGKPVFEFLVENPDAQKSFNDAMTSFAVNTHVSVAGSYDFDGIDTLVDIGGGHGMMLGTILRANEDMRGVLFDLPHVVEGADHVLGRLGVDDRVERQGGNFFEQVPDGHTGYIMSHIIHDWDDDRAAKILQNVRRGIAPEGRLMVVETVVPDGPEMSPAKVLDLEMLVHPGGRERTADEYAALFKRAGFKLTEVVPTKSQVSVVEGVPV